MYTQTSELRGVVASLAREISQLPDDETGSSQLRLADVEIRLDALEALVHRDRVPAVEELEVLLKQRICSELAWITWEIAGVPGLIERRAGDNEPEPVASWEQARHLLEAVPDEPALIRIRDRIYAVVESGLDTK